jgi:protein-glucosylgalactosylhydroxylysine glucosidase
MLHYSALPTSPLQAMARMTWDPASVVGYLLAAGTQNNYIPTGYNYNGNFAYLPGNGGTLLTVAMMAAGTDTSPPMAFPSEWNAVSEGFNTQYP